MEDKFKLSILKSEKKEQQLYLLRLRISEGKLLNGKFGILILRISTVKRIKMMRKGIKRLMLLLKNPHLKLADTHPLSSDVWKLWKEPSGKMKKIVNIETTSIIGRKENNKKELKVNFFPYGGFITKRKRNMWHQSAGIPSIKIFLLFLWVAMILPNRKQDRS